MSILKKNQLEKDNYKILIDLLSICRLDDDGYPLLHPCRLKAVNHLYDNGNKIILFTSITEDKKNVVESRLSDLKYHKIIFDFEEDVDFIVSSDSRENRSFFNELFDRNYKISHPPYAMEYIFR